MRLEVNPPLAHRGVAADDPRNAGPVDHFRPRPVTRQSARAMLAPYHRDEAELEAKIDALLQRIASVPNRPEPPLSQPLEAVANPWFGLSTHPDIIEELWKLDDGLPRRCRWVLRGRPALVHPETGVIFAVGVGTLGMVMRLPGSVLATADPACASVTAGGNPGRTFDISDAGPEWRFVGRNAPKAEWTRAAFEFASVPLRPRNTSS